MNTKKTEKEDKLKIAQHWSFPWSIMDVLIGGKSSIDLLALSIESEKDAQLFLESYGYFPASDKDRKKMHSVLVESLYFIEKYLMPKEWKRGLVPPDEVLLCDDPTKLLVFASPKLNDSSHASKVKQAWSCATLKVMHTISHLDDLHRLNNIQEARSQIMGRFQKALFRDKEGKLWFGDKNSYIELARVDWKPYKSRNSMILKLLHKPANVAETIFDLLGVRIITKNLSETLLAVKFLRQFYLVDFANIHPSRSRNNLIDVDQFHMHIETLKQMLLNENISIDGFEGMVKKLDTPVNLRKTSNPHSSSHYRSIQLTCRQRVRYLDPHTTWQEKLNYYLKDHDLSLENRQVISDFLQFASNWNHAEKHKEISIFFPFEVQIMDEEAARSIEQGEASHDRYKRAQIRTARRRILSKVLSL